MMWLKRLAMLMDITVTTTMNIRVISSFLGGLLGTFK